jgi:guanyl-specific ribonuclease Sa
MSTGRNKRIAGMLVSVVAAGLLFVGSAVGFQTPSYATPTATHQGPAATTGVTIPQRARDTLARIDAGTWPPNDGSGTHGGTTWTDAEGTLPHTDSSGRPVNYLEWDVNVKLPHHNRDAERIVTGGDGSAWYTGDHYATFTRMR